MAVKVKKKNNKLIFRRNNFSFLRLAGFAAVFMAIGLVVLSQISATTTISNSDRILPAGEASGLVASQSHPNVFWWMRDGGPSTAEKPREAIYALKVDANGNTQPVRGDDKFPFFEINGVKNSNWEDIALDDDNNLWIGDIGANNCSRSSQKLYRVKEPDPTKSSKLDVDASYTFSFPDPANGCNTWNSEAMFWLDGKMYIFAKTKNSPLYRVDLPKGNTGKATLKRLGTLSGGASNISASSLSGDRTRLMVASHNQTSIYQASSSSLKGDDLVKDLISKKPAYQARFDCKCSDKTAAVEGGSFRKDSLATVYVSETKRLYTADPAEYGDSSQPEPSTEVDDGAAPSVNITSPTSGEVVKGTITVGVNATDNVDVTRVRITYGDQKVIRDNTKTGKYGWGSRFDTRTISDGKYTITAAAYDAAGNVSTASREVIVDNIEGGDETNPEVKITSLGEGQTVGGTIVIGVDASDDVALESVVIYHSGNQEIRSAETADSVYGWGSRFDTTTLEDGEQAITVVAKDKSGNTATDEVTFIVNNSDGDGAAPNVEITSLSTNQEVNGTITIEVNASDDVALSNVNIYYDSLKGVIRQGTAEGNYGWGSRFDTRKISNGTHTLIVEAIDTAGNLNTDRVTIKVAN